MTTVERKEVPEESGHELSLPVLSERRAIVAGATAFVITSSIFIVLNTLFTSFPVFSLSPVAYATSVTLGVWVSLFLSSAIGVGIATSYWYSLQSGTIAQEFIDPPLELFLGSSILTLILVAVLGFVRILLSIAVGVLLLVLAVAAPIYFLWAVAKRRFGHVLLSITLLAFFVAAYNFISLYNNNLISIEQSSTAVIITFIGLLTVLLPALVGLGNFKDLEDDADEFVNQVEILDTEIRQLDNELLAQYGLKIPCRRAAADSGKVDEPPESVFIPDFNQDNVEAIVSYFQELRNFESQLASTVAESAGSATLPKRLSTLLNERHSKLPEGPRSERIVVDTANEILEAHRTLVEHGDEEGVSELDSQIEEVLSDELSGNYGLEAAEIASRLDEIKVWASERARRINLQSIRTDLRDRWNAEVRGSFSLDNSTFDYLLGSNPTELSLSELESRTKMSELVITLANRLESVQSNQSMGVLERFPQAFGSYLDAGDISIARIERLEATLDVVEAASEAKRRYPSYPFEQILEDLCMSLEAGELNNDSYELIELIDGATDVLDFLDSLNVVHPSVQPEEWRDNVRTSLETVSPELVRPLARLVNRMGDTLWERRHLFQFSWEEFEELVASVFEAQGYETSVTQATNDEGVDVWARSGGTRMAIQVKRHDTSNRIGRPTLQKLASTIAKDDADEAIVVTTGEFAQTARNYAADFGDKMRLIDGIELTQMLTEMDIPPPVPEQS